MIESKHKLYQPIDLSRHEFAEHWTQMGQYS